MTLEPPVDRRKRRTHTAVLDAAQVLFLREGYRGTTIDMLAAEADVAVSSIYANFREGKADVYAALAWPGARAVVSLAVTTDLSQFTAVKSPALDNVLLYLDAHVRSMRNDLRFHLDRMRLGQPELFEHFAKLG